METVVVETAGWIRGVLEAETVEVTLCYDPADPYAVTVAFRGEGRECSWVLSRDLLADGLRSMAPLGEGLVQVQATSVLTEISHRAPDGDVTVLRLPWWNTREFLRMAQSAVPRGQETTDVDAWVAALTAPQEP